MRRRTRMPLDEFVQLIDVDATKAILDTARATLGEIPCHRHGYELPWQPCDKRGKTPPEPHQSCGMCFSWRDCTDPECNHPACGHGVSNRFRDAFTEAFPVLAAIDVLVERTDVHPLLKSGSRLHEIVDSIEADEKAGRTLYEALQKKSEWQQLYDVRIDTMKHTEAEVWLVKQGISVEHTWATYSLGMWVAMSVAQGEERHGGMTVGELRLARPSDLSNAAELTQGALF